MSGLFQAVPSGYVLTSGANSALTWTNALTTSTISASTLNASALTVSTLTVNSLETTSTTTTKLLNYSSIVGSSISTNAMTLSLTNVSTQNTQIYQVATTNPTTSYTAIQASHVSTGTTNNALALNPSGGNVGVGTTAPGAILHVNGTTYPSIKLSDSTNTSDYMEFIRDHFSNVSIIRTTGALHFETPAGSKRMTILGNGNVGIGETTPVTALHIKNSTSDPTIGPDFLVSTGHGQILLRNTKTGSSPYSMTIGVDQTTGAGYMNAAGNSIFQPVCLQTRGGNVGVGTTNPSANLHIIGATSIANTTTLKVLNSGAGLNGTGSDLVTTQIDLGAGYGPYLRAVQPNTTYTDGIRLDLCTNLASNNGTPTPRLTILPVSGNVGIGTTAPSATLQVNGSLAKSSGTFDIGHPLHPDTNKRLVHSFIEGPRCDLIYRGKTTLVNGSAIVNIDKECTHSPECAMEDGTFEALCDNPQVFLQNNASFDRVRGVVSGATLTITCETQAAVEIEWMVIAERADPFIKQWDRTNPDGYLVTEYDAPAAPASSDVPAPTGV